MQLRSLSGYQKLFQNYLTFSQCSTWLSCSDQRGFLHLQKDFPQLFWLTLFWVSQCRFLLCYHMNLYHCKAYSHRILLMWPYLYEGSLRFCVIHILKNTSDLFLSRELTGSFVLLTNSEKAKF